MGIIGWPSKKRSGVHPPELPRMAVAMTAMAPVSVQLPDPRRSEREREDCAETGRWAHRKHKGPAGGQGWASFADPRRRLPTQREIQTGPGRRARKGAWPSRRSGRVGVSKTAG